MSRKLSAILISMVLVSSCATPLAKGPEPKRQPTVVAESATEKAKGNEWTYIGEFHRRIQDADRIVVRDGGFDCCQRVENHEILFELEDRREIKEILENLHFEKTQTTRSCRCCGYPGIDWYRGDIRLALTAVQHGSAIRWKEFPGDARLTKASEKWLKQWLIRRHIDKDKAMFRLEDEEEKKK